MEKVSGLGDLGPLMPGLSSSCNVDVILTLDNFAHRLCGFQQVNEIAMLFGEKLNNVHSFSLLPLTGALYVTHPRSHFLGPRLKSGSTVCSSLNHHRTTTLYIVQWHYNLLDIVWWCTDHVWWCQCI